MEQLGYKICSGWLEEFCIYTSDYMQGFHDGKEFSFEAICNYHCYGNEPVISEKYWKFFVEKFGLKLEKDAEVIHDWSVVKPSKADRMMDTRSIDGRFSDRDLFEFALKVSSNELE